MEHSFQWQIPQESGKPVLLFIHGLGCDATHYRAAYTMEVCKPYTIWVPDLPGYGQNAGVPHPYSLEAIAAALREAILQLTVPVVLIGHSMGGAIALLIVQQRVSSVVGVINVEGNLIAADCTFSRKAATVPYDRFLNERLPALLRAYRHHPYGASVRRADPPSFYQHSQDLVRLSDSEVLLHQFLHLSLPRIYVYGNENREHPVLPRLSGIPKIEISRSGHFPMLDNPPEFYQAVAMAAESMIS